MQARSGQLVNEYAPMSYRKKYEDLFKNIINYG